jgi:predicted nucleic acid-binding protein
MNAQPRLVLDANVILTAFLVRNSQSRQVLKLCESGKVLGFTCEWTLEEARQKLAAEAEAVDLLTGLHRMIRDCMINVANDPDPESIRLFEEGIKKQGDRMVAATAYEQEAVICTNDIKDLNADSTGGLDCKTPDEFMWTGEARASSGFICLPDQGTIGITINTHVSERELNEKPPRYDTILELGGRFRFRIAINRSLVMFELDRGPLLKVDIQGVKLSDKQPISIFGAFDAEQGADLIVIDSDWVIRQATIEDQWEPSLTLPPDAAIKPFPVAHHCYGFRGFCSFPYRMGRKGVLRILRGKRVDNPFERLSVKEMIALAEAQRRPRAI